MGIYRKIPIISLKGGTGKSYCTAKIGLALKVMGYRVGFLDLDVHGPTLPLSLGLDTAPRLTTDTVKQMIVPAEVNGCQLISMASHFGEGTRILWRGGDKLNLAKQLLTDIIAWRDLDYLMIDTPPSQGEEIMGLFDYLPDIYGVVIVCQPTDFAKADTDRVLDLLRDRHVPIIGIIANMDGAICPHCGERFYPFLTKRADIEQYSISHNIPFLASIPQVSSTEQLKPVFAQVAGKILTMTPITLPSHEKRKLFKRESLKILLEDDNA